MTLQTPDQVLATPADQLANLSPEYLMQLRSNASALLSLANAVTDHLETALEIKYAKRAQVLRLAAGKDTGIIHFDDGDVRVTAELPKRIDWDQKNEHPLLLSLSQVNTAMEKTTTPSLLLYARWHYWWSHFFWSLTLVPLAPALLLGQGSRYWKMLWSGCGILGCLTLYLIKEWLYAISIPLAHSWPPLLLWIPCLLTGCLSWIIFFEKKVIV